MPNAYISGTGHYLPPRVVTNEELAREYNIETTHEWIVQRTGIEERRYADAGVGTCELAVPAVQMALKNAGLRAQDLDMIIFGTLSPQHHFPGTGVYLQRALGLCDGPDAKFVPCLDVRNQCSAFLYSLGTAASMVQSGACKHVLIVGSEVHSHALDMSTRGRTVTTLFGDGAGAVIVSATDEDRGVRGWWLGADGRFADELAMKIWDIRNFPFFPLDEKGVGLSPPEVLWPQMNGKLVFRHAVERMIEAMMQAFGSLGISLDQVDLFAFHQANLRINQYIAQNVGIPENKLLSNIQRYGNTTAATIPLLLSEAEANGQLKRGMKVCAVAFGSGFTWGSAIIDW